MNCSIKCCLEIGYPVGVGIEDETVMLALLEPTAFVAWTVSVNVPAGAVRNPGATEICPELSIANAPFGLPDVIEKLVGLLVAATVATLVPALAGKAKETEAAVTTGAANVGVGSDVKLVKPLVQPIKVHANDREMKLHISERDTKILPKA